MSRRPTIKPALIAPRPTIRTMYIRSLSESPGWIALSITPPVTQTSAIWAACEPQASTIETASETLYGLRKPSRRANVCR
jgi:hypothetical protein